MSYNNPWALAPGLEDDASVVEQVQFNISETHDEEGIPLEYTDSETGESISEPIEAQAADAELQVAEAEDVVEKLQDTSEDLESHLIGIESRINNEDGLTANEVDTMLVGLRRTFPNIASINPGTESFNRNRLVASNEVKDRLMSGLSALWEKIKAAVEKVRAKMSEWFNKLLSKAAGVKRKVQAVKKKADRTKGSPEDDTVEISGLGDVLADSKGKYPKDGGAVLTQVKELNAMAAWFYEPVAKSTKNVVKGMKSEFDKIITNVAARADADTSSKGPEDNMAAMTLFESATKINDMPKGGAATAYNIGNDPRWAGADDVVYVELPGNMAMFYGNGSKAVNQKSQTASGVAELDNHYSLLGPRFMKFDNVTDRRLEKKEEYSVISTANVAAICDEAIRILDKIIAFNTSYNDVKNLNKELVREIDKAVAKADKNKAFKEKPSYRAGVQKIIRGGGTLMTKTMDATPKFSSHVMKVINAYMMWCLKSLANHKLD